MEVARVFKGVFMVPVVILIRVLCFGYITVYWELLRVFKGVLRIVVMF